jgi:tRNA A-37 threonylcarbamoyl transferase component Bud32/tetratricopeptide (TPR) repeat protein
VIDAISSLNTALEGRYVVESELGRGGMATVYLARDTKHDRHVALKVLRPELAAVIGSARFLNEIRITARLQHPHILPLHDSGEAGGYLFYVMPYVEGETLRARVAREGQLPLDDAVNITRQIADALAYAHSRNVVHRDVKPENILLQGEHAVVADFGISRAIEAAGRARVTATGLAIGTPAYMSPEQASGAERVDGRSDVYSLACVLYEMLGGEPPHTGVTPQAILARQLTGDVQSLRPLRTSVTPQLDAVLRRALAPAAADRFATAHDFGTAVRSAVRASAAIRAVRSLRVTRRSIVIAAALLVAGITVAAVVLLRSRSTGAASDGRAGVAVFPFRPGGTGEGWSETLADLLATALEGTPGLRIADPWALWQPLRPTRGARAIAPDPDEAERLARGAQAGHYVMGSVTQSGERLELSVRIYRAGTSEPLQSILAGGATDSLADIVQHLAVQVIGSLWAVEDSAPSVRRIEGYATRSAEALKAYLDAREAMRRGRVAEAAQAIDRALAADSSFAIAYVEAARVKSWAAFMEGRAFVGILPLAERALAIGDSLSERQRLRAQWMLASVRTDGAAAAEAAQRLIHLDGADLEAWDMAAYTHQVYGWQYGAQPDRALEAADRVVELDSTFVPGLLRRGWLAAATGDADDRRRQLARLSTSDTTSALVRGAMLGLEGLLVADTDLGSVFDQIGQYDPPVWLGALRQLRAGAPDRAEQLLATLAQTAGPGFPQRLVTGGTAQLAGSAGRIVALDSSIRSGQYDDLGGFARTLDLYIIASSIGGLGDSAVTERALTRVAAFIPPDSALTFFETRPVWWGAWAIGAWHAMYGDSTVTRRWHEVLGTLPCCGGTSEDYVGSLQSDLEARLAARRGELDSALVLARRAFDLWTIHTENVIESHPEPAMRLHMGLLLSATGHPDSAEAILSSLVPPVTWVGFLTARASFELGELAAARGAAALAARRYAAALALWRLGGREVADWRERAEAGLALARRRGG